MSANNLAVNLRALGEVARARELDEDTYARRRRVLGEDHPHTLAVANRLRDVRVGPLPFELDLQLVRRVEDAHHAMRSVLNLPLSACS